ncbi:Putative uncharacterized protein [Moritella viscosa]|nr:Putative uncharacterized protein [Moritella viscosa]
MIGSVGRFFQFVILSMINSKINIIKELICVLDEFHYG